jgi:hypothetical protein
MTALSKTNAKTDGTAKCYNLAKYNEKSDARFAFFLFSNFVAKKEANNPIELAKIIKNKRPHRGLPLNGAPVFGNIKWPFWPK